jgi:hypothetical protein
LRERERASLDVQLFVVRKEERGENEIYSHLPDFQRELVSLEVFLMGQSDANEQQRRWFDAMQQLRVLNEAEDDLSCTRIAIVPVVWEVKRVEKSERVKGSE